MNFTTIELKKYLPLAESGQVGAYPPVMNLHFSLTSCATSLKLKKAPGTCAFIDSADACCEEVRRDQFYSKGHALFHHAGTRY